MNTKETAKEFIAPSISAALRQVKAEFGAQAIILSQQSIDGKVRVFAVPGLVQSNQVVNSELQVPVQSKQLPISSLLEQALEDESHLLKDDIFSSTYLRTPSQRKEEDFKVNNEVEFIKSELETIKDLLKEKHASVTPHQVESDQNFNVHQLHIMRTLHQKRLNSSVINNFISSIPTDFSLEQSWHHVISKIVNVMNFDKAQLSTSKKIKSFIGPSGVGKSLLMAKLMIFFANKPLKNNFSIIFVNNSNLKVLEEAKIYSRLFGVPTYYAESIEELENAYKKSIDKDFIFIDFPPYDFNQSDNNFYVNFLQKHKDEIDNTFVISPHCNFTYIERYFTAFQKILIDGVSITKLDECNSCEEIINFIISHEIPVRHLSFGNLNFAQGFSSRLIFGDKQYFYEYLTHSLMNSN